MNQAIPLILSFILMGAHTVSGIAPNFISDAELAQSPVIVVGQWENAPFTSHNKYRDDFGSDQVIADSEAYTKLRILRVIKGSDLKPGEHHLMTGLGISWSEDGAWVSSGTSTELLGDVGNITQPNLWFLKKSRSCWPGAMKVSSRPS